MLLLTDFIWNHATYCFDDSDQEVLQASTFRARCRLPAISWCHPGNGKTWYLCCCLLRILSFCFEISMIIRNWSSPCTFVATISWTYDEYEEVHWSSHFWFSLSIFMKKLTQKSEHAQIRNVWILQCLAIGFSQKACKLNHRN